jgi:hypothetical protein
MAYAKKFAKISYLFTVAGTDEMAVTSLDVSHPTINPNPAVMADALFANGEDTYLDFLALINGSTLNHATYSALAAIKYASLDESGHYTDDPRIYTPAGTTPGSGGQTNAQLTVVASLRAATTLGPGKRGRMYLPHTRLTQSSGSPQGTGYGGVADDVAGHISLLNTYAEAVLSGAGVCIMGQTGTGTVQRVTSVKVGSVTDTQRRHRDQLDETYATTAVT